MIKIHFEGNNWSELREQIQEFAVAHLHAKFGDMKLEQGAVTGGHSDQTIPAAETVAKKPRAKSAPKDVAADAKINPPVVAKDEQGPVTTENLKSAVATSPAHTLEECTAALQKVWDKHGMETSLECLTRFGAKRARELDPKSYANFIALCEEKSK